MKKPAHGITLQTAKEIIAQVAAGETLVNPAALPKAREVVRYWAWKAAQKRA